MALGYTKTLSEDKYLPSRSQFNDELAFLLGGRVAEELTFNEVTTGASDDIKRATMLARKMVTDFGMSEKLGPRTFGDKQELVFLGREISEQRDYSEKVALQIDEEVNSFIQGAYNTAKNILTKNKPKLIQIAQTLITEETLDGEKLETLFNKLFGLPLSETTATPAATPAEAPTKTKRAPKPKKAPKYAPAPPKTSPGYV